MRNCLDAHLSQIVTLTLTVWPINSGILTSLLLPHLSSSLKDCLPSLNLLCHPKTDARFMQDGRKAVWSIPYVSVSFFPSLKQNFIAYHSSKVSSRPNCIFEIHQQWQSGFSRVYFNYCCSCSFEPEIIKIGRSSHKMYSNNIPNFEESTTILNAHTKNVWRLIICPSYFPPRLLLHYPVALSDITVNLCIKQVDNDNRLKTIQKTIPITNTLYTKRFIGLVVRILTNRLGDRGSIPGRVIPKTLKMLLDTSSFNTQHYKIRINRKVEKPRERSTALPNISV